jgi:prophage tail gpP-like protein
MDTSGLFQDKPGLFYDTETDPNVGRHRRLVLVAEGVMGGLELAKNRALWEASRRAGRGRSVTLTADSWRDSKGKLWAPNTLAPVSLPSLGLTDATWCISEVTYKLAEGSGRTADLQLMPQEAFQPEPIMLQPQIGGVIPAASTETAN